MLLYTIFIAVGKIENEVHNFENNDLNRIWYLEYILEIDSKKKKEVFQRYTKLEEIKRRQLQAVMVDLKKQSALNKLIVTWSCYIYCEGRRTFKVVKNNNTDFEANLIKEEILIPLKKDTPEIGIKLEEYN